MKALYGDILSRLEEAPKWWYFSFADEHRFRGACFVSGATLEEAITMSHILCINPGGQIACVQVPADMAPLIPDHWRNRLMSREDVDAFDREMGAVN